MKTKSLTVSCDCEVGHQCWKSHGFWRGRRVPRASECLDKGVCDKGGGGNVLCTRASETTKVGTGAGGLGSSFRVRPWAEKIS